MTQQEEKFIDNDDPLKKIPVFTAIHPDNEPYSREIAASKKDIRTNRSNIEHACSNCTRLGNEHTTLLKCARVSKISPVFADWHSQQVYSNPVQDRVVLFQGGQFLSPLICTFLKWRVRLLSKATMVRQGLASMNAQNSPVL
jgi:hypothetical protein